MVSLDLETSPYEIWMPIIYCIQDYHHLCITCGFTQIVFLQLLTMNAKGCTSCINIILRPFPIKYDTANTRVVHMVSFKDEIDFSMTSLQKNNYYLIMKLREKLFFIFWWFLLKKLVFLGHSSRFEVTILVKLVTMFLK